jgi:glucosamine 6-phosphate synthetase-like amidotransferase/phosphosugar isomerase protein
MRAGPEIAVAATKTFTTQVLTLLYIVARLAEFVGSIDVDYRALIQGLKISHEVAQSILKASVEICKAIATELQGSNLLITLAGFLECP